MINKALYAKYTLDAGTGSFVTKKVMSKSSAK